MPKQEQKGSKADVLKNSLAEAGKAMGKAYVSFSKSRAASAAKKLMPLTKAMDITTDFKTNLDGGHSRVASAAGAGAGFFTKTAVNSMGIAQLGAAGVAASTGAGMVAAAPLVVSGAYALTQADKIGKVVNDLVADGIDAIPFAQLGKMARNLIVTPALVFPNILTFAQWCSYEFVRDLRADILGSSDISKQQFGNLQSGLDALGYKAYTQDLYQHLNENQKGIFERVFQQEVEKYLELDTEGNLSIIGYSDGVTQHPKGPTKPQHKGPTKKSQNSVSNGLYF